MNNFYPILDNLRRADITFHRNGKIDISSRISRLLGIQPGNVIDILTNGFEFYLYVVNVNSDSIGRYEARVCATKHNSNYLRAYSKRLCQSFLSSDDSRKSLGFPCGEVCTINSHKAVSIITRFNINRNDKGN